MYPKKISEFDVQAELYWKLKELFRENPLFTVHGEVRVMTEEKSGGARKQIHRFDIVVFFEKNAILVFEVKGRKKTGLSAQIRKYSRYGVKVLPCIGKNGIDRTIREVKEHIKIAPFIGNAF